MMIYRVLRLPLAMSLAFASLFAHAQGLRVPGAPPVSAPSGGAAVSGAQRSADFIVAIVNTEPITNSQVRQEMQSIARNAAQRDVPVPDAKQLADEALERLINDRAQLHLARESGIKVEDASVDDAEQSVARQNRVDVAELQRRMAADGLDRAQFRRQLRDQLMIMRLRERDVTSKVKVSETDIDRYLREQQQNPDQSNMEIGLAQVLVALPDEPTPAQVAAGQTKINQVMERARAGEDFAKLARDISNAPEAASGGELGLRPADRYPSLFADATRSLPVGGLVVVRSGAGFHLLKVVDKRAPGMPAATNDQTRASHILLRASPQMDETTARARLTALRQRILSGAVDFATAAKENSQDASAAQGGDLGWTNAGQFVPEFEEAMASLAPGQISEPVVSRFGMHLITVKERRSVPLTQREQREAVRAILREKKLDEQFITWAQDLRTRAYVDVRQPPSY